MNYYDLFELPVAPLADHTYVSKKFVELQRKFHPDFFTQGTEAEQEEALQRSADVNKAYQVFRNKDRSLEYFLKEKAVLETDEKYQLPADFLMDMMELNEALTEGETDNVQAKVDEAEKALDADVAGILGKSDASLISDSELQELKAYYFKKKYLKRILDRLGD